MSKVDRQQDRHTYLTTIAALARRYGGKHRISKIVPGWGRIDTEVTVVTRQTRATGIRHTLTAVDYTPDGEEMGRAMGEDYVTIKRKQGRKRFWRGPRWWTREVRETEN